MLFSTKKEQIKGLSIFEYGTIATESRDYL
jgi:hypothetical protein